MAHCGLRSLYMVYNYICHSYYWGIITVLNFGKLCVLHLNPTASVRGQVKEFPNQLHKDWNLTFVWPLRSSRERRLCRGKVIYLAQCSHVLLNEGARVWDLHFIDDNLRLGTTKAISQSHVTNSSRARIRTERGMAPNLEPAGQPLCFTPVEYWVWSIFAPHFRSAASGLVLFLNRLDPHGSCEWVDSFGFVDT